MSCSSVDSGSPVSSRDSGSTGWGLEIGRIAAIPDGFETKKSYRNCTRLGVPGVRLPLVKNVLEVLVEDGGSGLQGAVVQNQVRAFMRPDGRDWHFTGKSDRALSELPIRSE